MSTSGSLPGRCARGIRDQQTLLAIAQVQQLASPLGGDLLKRTLERLAVRQLANEVLTGLAQQAAGGQLLVGGIVAKAHHAASVADDQAQRDLVEQGRPEVWVNCEHPTLICARKVRQHGGSHGCALDVDHGELLGCEASSRVHDDTVSPGGPRCPWAR